MHPTPTTSSASRLLRPLFLAIVLLIGSVAIAPLTASAAAPVAVDIAVAPDGNGYWMLFADGRVETSGSASAYGNGGPSAAAIAVRPNGDGYWIAHANGLVVARGSAPTLPDVDHFSLAAPIVAMASTPSGNGYWLVASDGGIFTSGDAGFYGSTGGMQLARPVVGIAPTPQGGGYWLVAKDGGVFSFGNATFMGSLGGIHLDADVIAMVASPGGAGYMMVGADGGIFAFGATTFHGSLGGQGRTDIIGAAPLPNGTGYYMSTRGGQVFGFGNAVADDPPTSESVAAIEARIEQEIFARMNVDRALRGLPALRWDSELATTSAAWSDTMAASGFRHSNLGATIAGLPTFNLTAGENIYWGMAHFATSEQAHQTLMDSAGHRRAILETAYTTGAVGVTCRNGEIWVTEQFGHPDTDGPVNNAGARSQFPQADLSAMVSSICPQG